MTWEYAGVHSSHVIVTFVYSFTYCLFSRYDNLWKDGTPVLGRPCTSTDP